MITVNSLSGGKTSSYMAVHHPADIEIFACVCIDYPEAAPKDPAILKYCLEKLDGNFIASAEHDKTLKVMMQLEQLIGKEIVWVRGKSFDEVIDNAGCLPTWNRRFCTTELKIIPIFEYVYPRFGKVIMRIGYRADEPERRNRLKDNQDIFHPISCNTFGENRMNWESINWRESTCPLARIFHYEIRSFWRTIPAMDFPLDSNCRGCHHKPNELIHQNWEETPEHLELFAMQEEKKKGLGAKINTWHDDLIPYRKIFATHYNEKIDFDFTMCNSGGCTD
jgi:hypothetical protein